MIELLYAREKRIEVHKPDGRPPPIPEQLEHIKKGRVQNVIFCII